MSLSLGSTTIGSLYLGSTKVGEAYLGNVKVYSAAPALAPRSMRFDFKYDHFNPLTSLNDLSGSGLIWTHVADDVYDFHYDNADWGYRTIASDNNGGLFNVYAYKSGKNWVYPMGQHQFDLLDMDLTGVTTVSYLFCSARQVQNIFSIRNTSLVTDFTYFVGHTSRNITITSIPLFDTSSATTTELMFSNCTSLTSVPLFNTSNVTNMSNMFVNCTSLTSVPLFNTDNVTNVSYMFYNCSSVGSGALALYTQMANQATPPSSHAECFHKCGYNTVTGAAELSQIPSDWGGTAT